MGSRLFLRQNLGLADFDEDAARSKGAEVFRDEGARQGVHDDINASAVGCRHDFIGKDRLARIEDPACAFGQDEGTFCRRPRGGEDFHAREPCQTDSRQPDTTRAGVHQDAHARPEPARRRETESRRHVGIGHCHGVREIHPCRQLRSENGACDSVGRNGIPGEGNHRIAYREIDDTRAQDAYDPRNFAAQSARVTRIHAESVEDIAEIEPRCTDIDLQLTAARRPAALIHQPKIIEIAAGFDADHLPLRNLWLSRFGERLESLRKYRPVTYRHLDLGARQPGDKISDLGGVDRHPGIEIESETGRFGPLGCKRTRKTDDRRLGRITGIARFDRMRTSRQNAQARPRRNLGKDLGEHQVTLIHDCSVRRGIDAFTVVLDQIAGDHPVRQVAVRNRRPQHRWFV